ncbi:hypothetical protein J437_LFUL012483 [Ladona fulva]|uniref:Complex I assembly factor TIMMDC1, mitochondrial n=1 Tax=Ladona fulva TaxID=123851 RepID=A0A8K0P4J7_LADFU|nr:hypothetical protein J437_LFUL012483 [Ladona fulva]
MRLILCGFLPLYRKDPDEVSLTSKTAKEIDEAKKTETGLDRLQRMFTIEYANILTANEFDNLSPELTAVSQTSIMGLFVGALYGGLNRSKVAYLDFMEKNQATAFKSHLDAKKKLQDRVTLGLGKGAFQWGWRLGLFSGTYMLFTTAVATYKGKYGISEHVIAGVVTGGLYKCSLGLRGIAVGSLLGGVLGGFAGISSYGLLKLSGRSMDELLYWRKQWKDERNRKFDDSVFENRFINDDPYVKEYLDKHKSSPLLPKENENS